jgi:hypothetical protein
VGACGGVPAPLIRMRLRRVVVCLCASLAGASASVCALSALAVEPGHTIDVSRVLDAGALPKAPQDIVLTRTPADPEALVARSQWVLDLRWDRGDVWLLDVSTLELPAAQPTPRAMGRFALELFEGPALIERVRFDFPLLGAPDLGDGGYRAPPSLSQKLRTRIGVVFPATARGTRLELWDRATNRRWSLPWPLQSTIGMSGVDGGTVRKVGAP